MNKFKRMFSVMVGKSIILVSKLLGKKGSSLPGQIALKIYPNLISDCSKNIKKDIIAVCGTNGKTTTNNILYDFLTSKGYKIVCNNVGANMLEGIATAFVNSSTLWGSFSSDFACLEVDEASSIKIFRHIKPNIMIITNLFRDQLDRYGEIDITMSMLKKGLEQIPDVTLLLNGDDPLSSSFGFKNGSFNREKNKFFGIENSVNLNVNETKEGRFCAFCGKELDYDFYHYSQLGSYKCTCGFERPELDFKALNIILNDTLCFDLCTSNKSINININYKGFYNVYNIMSAVSVMEMINIEVKDINKVLADYKPQIGRMETFCLKKPVILNLSKNPAGFNQAISTLLQDKRKKDIIVVINDNAQDGKDISWIWDVDFEKFNHSNCLSYTASGIRKEDLLIRFKYAGFDLSRVRINDNIKSAITDAVNKKGEVCYILVNYTALFNTQDILKKLEKEYNNIQIKDTVDRKDTGLSA